MTILEVLTNKDIRLFHKIPYVLYRDDKNWIPPLRQEIEKIFDPEKNKLFHEGDAVRFILLDDNRKPVGRIAAFYRQKNLSQKIKAGGIGFFECIDDRQFAGLLFNTAKNWLQERGCNAMDGPVNFGERDKWWGLLVDGFKPPVYGLNYHLPYYKKLFESCGFKNYFEQYTYILDRDKGMPEIVYRINERLMKSGNIVIRAAEKDNLKKYTEDFRSIYNQAWAHHEGVQPMTEEQSERLMDEIKPIMDPSLLLFAYVNDEPAGFFIGIPDANQLLKYAHGNLNTRGKLNVLLHRPFVRFEHVYGIIFGVVPGHQNKGIEACLAATMHEMVKKSRYYRQIELLWIGDFNKKMLKFVRHIQATKYRTLITYRIIFDEDIPFERCPVIE